MKPSFVALDIETTGLDMSADRIIEVAACRIAEDGTTTETYSSLVNPGRAIPYFIETLTGITTDAVSSAPTIQSVASELVRFVGEANVVGQNIGFDMAFLRREGIEFAGAAIDTAELSRLLMPERQARGLMSLAATLGVETEVHHRALADAVSAAGVFTALQKRAEEIPEDIRLQLARLVSIQNPSLAEVIAGEEWASGVRSGFAPLTIRPATVAPPLTLADPIVPITRGQVRKAFAAAGRVMSGFEERPQQLAMADAAGRAFAEGGHWLVEAGTGVGKSLAYLVPAALHALQNGQRVVVSTNTINLQEQLLTKDVPAVRRILREAGVIEDDADLRVSLLKGRANYLCLRRWTANLASSVGDPDFAKLAASMLLWLPTTETGDRSELSLDGADYHTWPRVSAQDTDCLARHVTQVREGNCFLQRARKAAESAHIIIANHALLLADIASGGNALPPFDHLIIDEAHNLEDQATNQFGARVSMRTMQDALDGLYRRANRDRSGHEQREGGVATLLTSFPEGATRSAGEALESAVRSAVQPVAKCFDALARLAPARGEEERALVTGAMRASDDWEAVEEAWTGADRALRKASEKAGAASQLLRSTALAEDPDVLAGEIETATRKLDDQRMLLESLLGRSDPAQIVWVAAERDGSGSINAAPLDVGPTLWEQLFSKKETVIATSATLSAAGSMEFAAQRLGLGEAGTVQLGSPFDYGSAVLLSAFTDIPEPGEQGYDDAIATAITELVLASEGRALVLFTSHGALRRAAQATRSALEEAGIVPLVQGVDGQPRQLTENLVSHPRSVIFGTSSFWEGVDVRGDALSMLIIARLPFAVPTDPIYRARSEQFDEPFAQFALPSAILRFRQGFGRLIRDRTDRGVVAVLDKRIYSKRYGEDFVGGLPRCTMTRGTSDVVAQRARDWLARE
ncbi:hypothetical protein AYO38_04735 [bacterium SCGC AG-212-C10]|nr:hypothetical protein AYO38_04735 [bacterium SCGC AG-212-C10]